MAGSEASNTFVEVFHPVKYSSFNSMTIELISSVPDACKGLAARGPLVVTAPPSAS